jgi:hypothetical protein
MLALAMFTVLVAGLVFLLRFLYALDCEIRSTRMHAKAKVEHASAYQFASGMRVHQAVPVLTLVHTNTFWERIDPHPTSGLVGSSRERISA